ncbi:MAG: hypothetical protein ABTQ29_01165 [Siculibacillus sp.]
MSILGEIDGALRGTIALILGDRRGIDALDCTLTGFWRSFFVIVPMLPLLVVSVVADGDLRAAHGVDTTTQSLAGRLFADGLVWILGWIAFPAVLALLARPLGLGRVYVPWIVARNWSTLPATLPYAVVLIGWSLGLLPDAVLAPGTLASLVFGLFVGWRVAVLVGGQTTGAAIGYTLLDFLLSLVVEVAVDRLFGL